MRHFTTIISHEIRALLYSASTYIAAVLFLFVMAILFTMLVDDYTKAAQEAPLAAVYFQYFLIPVFFMVPLLTMRSLAEERRLGTLETLLTTSVSTTEVVLGKFFASYLLYLCLWGSTVGFHYILFHYAGDPRLVAPGPLLGGYLFIAVSGLLFIAVGIFASSLTRSQSVAAVGTFVILLLLIVATDYLAKAQFINREGLLTLKDSMESVQVLQHLEDFTHGVIDTRQIIYYVSGATLALIFSILGVEYKLLQG